MENKLDKTEYIDKNEILFQMSIGFVPQDLETTRAYAIAKEFIKRAPIVSDVKKITYGHWKPAVYSNCHYCSVCDKPATFDDYGEEVLGLACPYCASIMVK